jgi:hypothetical protein
MNFKRIGPALGIDKQIGDYPDNGFNDFNEL